MPRNDVRSVAERILQKQRSYVIPSYINDKEVHVLRDTGGLLVDETFASPEQIIPGRMVQVNGAFDTNFRTFPVAKIEFKCRRIGLDRNIVFEAVVTKFSDGLHCIIENKFFTELPFLCDIYLHISNQLWRRHAAHRAPASPPRELTDTPDRVDSLIECDGRGHSTTAGDVILPPGGDSERLTAARRDNTAVTPSHQVDAYHNTDDDRPSALMNNAAAGQMRETHTHETRVSAQTSRVDMDIIHDNACNTEPTSRNAQCSEMHKLTDTRHDLNTEMKQATTLLICL